MQRFFTPSLAIVALLLPAIAFSAETGDALDRDARDALRRATTQFQSISTRGGYLWWYSEDLKERAGENRATETQIWVQSPGTPAVGLALLRVYEVTKEARYLKAAQHAAEALA